MIYEITAPSGRVYANVWKADGRLQIEMLTTYLNGQHPIIQLDEKCIPQLQRIFEAMNTEDEEFNRIERESKQRMEAVTYNLNRAEIQEATNRFKTLLEEFCKVPLSFKNAKRTQILSELDETLKKL